eukprot:810004-Amphidinium_carterae.1
MSSCHQNWFPPWPNPLTHTLKSSSAASDLDLLLVAFMLTRRKSKVIYQRRTEHFRCEVAALEQYFFNERACHSTEHKKYWRKNHKTVSAWGLGGLGSLRSLCP